MNDALIHEIVIRFRGGASMRRIAHSLHISRRTVKRAAHHDGNVSGQFCLLEAPRCLDAVENGKAAGGPRKPPM